MSSIWSCLVVRCFEYSVVHTEPTAVWSWAESCSFDLYKPSRTISVGISLAAKRAWSHLVSKSWTSSCKRKLNRSDRLCTTFIGSGGQKMLVEHVCHFCHPREESVVFLQQRCSSTLTLFRKCTCVRSSFNADATIASSISWSGKSLLPVIGCDVTGSSIDFAISTSLIQCLVRWGSAVLEHTSVLKLTFQLWNSTESGG